MYNLAADLPVRQAGLTRYLNGIASPYRTNVRGLAQVFQHGPVRKRDLGLLPSPNFKWPRFRESYTPISLQVLSGFGVPGQPVSTHGAIEDMLEQLAVEEED